jgi:hypothetical protein
LKLNGKHQRLVYTDVHATEKNMEALVAAYKEMGQEVNVDKTKYMVMSRDQNAGRSHSMKIGKTCFDRVEKLMYLGEILTKQNSINEEIKSILNSGNACNHSMQNVCPAVCNPKMQSFRYTEFQLCLLFAYM